MHWQNTAHLALFLLLASDCLHTPRLFARTNWFLQVLHECWIGFLLFPSFKKIRANKGVIPHSLSALVMINYLSDISTLTNSLQRRHFTQSTTLPRTDSTAVSFCPQPGHSISRPVLVLHISSRVTIQRKSNYFINTYKAKYRNFFIFI